MKTELGMEKYDSDDKTHQLMQPPIDLINW